MAEVVTAEGAAARGIAAEQAAYRAGWADAIVAALERLPGPVWLGYAGLAFAGVLLILAEGATHRSGLAFLQPTYFIYLLFYLFPLAAYHYLSRGARSAWDSFRPATGLDDAAAERYRQELSTTPYRPVAVIWILSALFNFAASVAAPAYNDLADQPLAYFALRVLSESLWVAPMTIVFVYFVFRQWRLVSRLHATVERIDLIRPDPLHAMSRLTARAAIVLIVLVIFSSLPLPGITEAGWIATVLGWSLPMLLIAVAAFFLPLRGMSRRLAQEKGRLLGENAQRLQAVSSTLHGLVDEETSGVRSADDSRLAQSRIDALNKALSSLLAERDFIRRHSTWPWDGGTLRAVVSAIALPIALFVLTRLLDQLIF